MHEKIPSFVGSSCIHLSYESAACFTFDSSALLCSRSSGEKEKSYDGVYIVLMSFMLKIGTGGALPGSSQFTAAVRAKRNEACKTFLSSSSPLADYDSETRKLAAFAKEEKIFHKQNPMIFEPGDPRIAVAIAEMKFDPHEAFKPRPDSELEFLDPVELEVEHFKRYIYYSSITSQHIIQTDERHLAVLFTFSGFW